MLKDWIINWIQLMLKIGSKEAILEGYKKKVSNNSTTDSEVTTISEE